LKKYANSEIALKQQIGRIVITKQNNPHVSDSDKLRRKLNAEIQ
jgi:hypothetical protein